MPDFPGAVYSPATKSAGQTITAAFFNDPDSEITAIEGGYLNGTARLNSSNSTLANLSVTGGSTLGGTLQSSNSTLNALQVSSNSTFALRPTMPPPEAVRVYLDSTVTIGSSAASTISWLAQEFAINSSVHSTGTNPQRLTPQTTGVFSFLLQLARAAAGDQTARQVEIADSSAGLIGVTRLGSTTATNENIQAMGLKRFDVTGGYAIARFVQSGASTMSLSSGSGQSFFAMHKL